MNAIRSVFAALGNLASSINALAGILDVAAGRLRQQLALDDAPAVPSLPHAGEVLENEPAVAGNGASSRRGRK